MGISASTRNNVLAGGFLLAGVALAVITSFVLSDRAALAGTVPYIVRFSIMDGAAGLRDGAPVLLGGQQVGVVERVTFSTAPEVTAPTGASTPTDVDVLVRVRRDLALYSDAMVFLDRPLIGTLSTLNIASVGGPARARPAPAGVPNATPSSAGAAPTPPAPSPGAEAPRRLAANDVLRAMIAPPAFLASAGFGSEQAEQVRQFVDNASSLVARLDDFVERSTPGIDRIVADAGSVVSTFREKTPGWTQRVDRTAENVEKATERLGPIIESAEAGVREIRDGIASINQIIDANRDRIDSMVASLEHAAARIDEETLDLVNRALNEGKLAATDLREAVGVVSELVRTESPTIRRALANARLATDQLKLTAVEVRANPWRLLYTPTKKEERTQLLYDSARAYAEAASDLRAASEALAAITPSNPSAVRPLLEQVARMLERYDRTERELLQKLIDIEK